MLRKTVLLPIVAVVAAVAAVWAVTRTTGAADPGAVVEPGALPLAEAGAVATLPTVTVYKSPTCGCCTKWVEHVRRHGFEVVVHDTRDMAMVKSSSGVPRALESCHTAIVDGYIVEGHVPADLIRRLLDERPQVAGLAVPGMPMGSPGMEGPYKESYDVLAFDREGKTRVYASR